MFAPSTQMPRTQKAEQLNKPAGVTGVQQQSGNKSDPCECSSPSFRNTRSWAGLNLPAQKNPVASPAVIVCSGFLPRPRLRRVSDLGVARCAGHPCAVHKLPPSLHHK